jgi:hypothetical protein
MITQEHKIEAKEIMLEMYEYCQSFEDAKQCSIICVDKIISTLGTRYLGGNKNAFDYWYSVKDYLINLTYSEL